MNSSRLPGKRTNGSVLSLLTLACGSGAIASWGTGWFYAFVVCLCLIFVVVRTRRGLWSRRIRNDELSTGEVVYVDQPKPSLAMLAFEGFGVLFAVLVALGIPLTRDEMFGLRAAQWVLIIASFWFWFPFWRLLDPTRYVVTETGIWVQDRLRVAFIPFDELQEIETIERKLSWKGHQAHITRFSDLLLLIKEKSGWMQRNILLSPANRSEFMEHIPSRLVAERGKVQ